MLHEMCIVLILSLSVNIHADIFTAIAEVESLLKTQQITKDKLDLYIKKEENRLIKLKRYLYVYKREHEEAMKDIPKYLGNPINAFTLIKRLTSDLDYIKLIIKTQTEFDLENTTDYNVKNIKYPTSEDLKGAAEALARIQDTYSLEVKEFAEGRLHGTIYSTPMTASDCYELGRTLYEAEDFMSSLLWMLQALRKYNEEDNYYPFSEIEIIEFISFGYFKLGDMENALHWGRKIFDLGSNNSRIKKIIQLCLERIEKENTTMTMSLENRRTELSDPLEISYRPLCRGDVGIPLEISRRLTCRYLSETHPFLKLAPFKVEMMYINPDIVLFHDVLSDDEIEDIKQIAKPLLARSIVNNPSKDQPKAENFRISKSAWLNDTESYTSARISRRASHMTGLSMDTAEDLHVANYGIAGYYKSHYDFSKNTSRLKWDGGNRIATLLFYCALNGCSSVGSGITQAL